MVHSPTFRAAKASECEDVARLIRHALPPDLWPLSVAAQPGYSEYIRAHITWNKFLPNSHLHVVQRGPSTNVSGCADFRLLDRHAAFLSYIAIDPQSRGRGLGTALLDNFFSENPELTSISLDVFSSNTSAKRMYERQDFVVTGSTFWHTRPMPSAENLREIEILNAPSAHAQYARYGFTTFETMISGRRVSIGQIGADTIRAFTSAEFADPGFMAAARQIAPSAKTILFIGDLDHNETRGAALVAESLRMTRNLP